MEKDAFFFQVEWPLKNQFHCISEITTTNYLTHDLFRKKVDFRNILQLKSLELPLA